MKPITLRLPKDEPLCGVVRLTPDAELTLRRIKEQTSLSMTVIASELICQAYENGVIEMLTGSGEKKRIGGKDSAVNQT